MLLPNTATIFTIKIISNASDIRGKSFCFLRILIYFQFLQIGRIMGKQLGGGFIMSFSSFYLNKQEKKKL